MFKQAKKEKNSSKMYHFWTWSNGTAMFSGINTRFVDMLHSGTMVNKYDNNSISTI